MSIPLFRPFPRNTTRTTAAPGFLSIFRFLLAELEAIVEAGEAQERHTARRYLQGEHRGPDDTMAAPATADGEALYSKG